MIMNNNLDFAFGASTLIGLVPDAGTMGLGVGTAAGDFFRASKSDCKVRTEMSDELDLGGSPLSLKLWTGNGGVGIGREGIVGIGGVKETGRGGVGGVIGLGKRPSSSCIAGLRTGKGGSAMLSRGRGSAGKDGGVGRENPPDWG